MFIIVQKYFSINLFVSAFANKCSAAFYKIILPVITTTFYKIVAIGWDDYFLF